MKAISILFLSVIAATSSHVAKTTYPSTQQFCDEQGPNVYCNSVELINFCKVEAFCKEYLLRSPCEKGPEVFCKTTKKAKFCKKEVYCLTWPDTSITATKVEPPSPSGARRPVYA